MPFTSSTLPFQRGCHCTLEGMYPASFRESLGSKVFEEKLYKVETALEGRGDYKERFPAVCYPFCFPNLGQTSTHSFIELEKEADDPRL